MTASDNPLAWLHGELRTPPLSDSARVEAGFVLRRIQRGDHLGLPHSRPMPTIGPRCHELRIVDSVRRYLRKVNEVEADKQRRLEAAGWRVGDAAEFLGLAPEEATVIEMKLALSVRLRQRRGERMTQSELAQRIGSSQPRVAMAESGKSVSMDLLVRAMLATGATPGEIGETIAGVAAEQSTNRRKPGSSGAPEAI